MVYFATRSLARAAQFGTLVDNGPDSPKGKRYARKLDFSQRKGN